MSSKKIQFILILIIAALTFPQQSFSLNIGESQSDKTTGYMDSNPVKINLVDLLKNLIISGAQESAVDYQKQIKDSMGLILQKIQELSE